MGYYGQIESSTFMLKKEDYEEAYVAMCALNQFDSIKRGGSYHKDQDTGVVTESRWFSWMPDNYPDVLTTAEEIFTMLGFEINTSDTGLEIYGYDDKIGQEDLFLEACCPWASGNIEWRGEDGEIWMDNYDHMTVRRYYRSEEWVHQQDYVGAMADALDFAAWRDNMREDRRKAREEENVKA
jgi:hypothetical protein|tara:strand:- start:2275 stop:2820 length:546 start_codon:yes stop_codon:yes gene_type:complete